MGASDEGTVHERVATCACGAASATLAGLVKLHAICHCANCKRRTGSAFG